MDIYPSITLHKIFVLTYSGLQLVKTQRVNFTKINLFSNVNICGMKQIFRRQKHHTKKPVFLYMFEKSLFYFRTEIAILSGRKIHLQQRAFPFHIQNPMQTTMN